MPAVLSKSRLTFDERIANEPKVSYRDNRFFVFDGQHTIAARKLLNNGEDLPVKCKVYFDMTEKDEALLFAQQTGVSAPLSAGARLRANIFGGDPIAIAFLEANNDIGIEIDYDQERGLNRIGCIQTAYDAYNSIGEERYKGSHEHSQNGLERRTRFLPCGKMCSALQSSLTFTTMNIAPTGL